MFIVGRYLPEAAYANYLKTFLKERVNVLKIIDFRELKIFKGVDIWYHSNLQFRKDLQL